MPFCIFPSLFFFQNCDLPKKNGNDDIVIRYHTIHIDLLKKVNLKQLYSSWYLWGSKKLHNRFVFKSTSYFPCSLSLKKVKKYFKNSINKVNIIMNQCMNEFPSGDFWNTLWFWRWLHCFSLSFNLEEVKKLKNKQQHVYWR